MGLFDVILGKRKLRQPSSDRLFAMTIAQITLETALDMHGKGVAGIVFKPLETADFREILGQMKELLISSSSDSSTSIEERDDEFGYRWVVLKDSDFEDLVTTINLINTELQAGGYADRVLCAVMPFADSRSRVAYWIYNFRRGSWYPFVPRPDRPKERDTERELRLNAAVGHELPIEPELERWFPLWGIPI